MVLIKIIAIHLNSLSSPFPQPCHSKIFRARDRSYVGRQHFRLRSFASLFFSSSVIITLRFCYCFRGKRAPGICGPVQRTQGGTQGGTQALHVGASDKETRRSGGESHVRRLALQNRQSTDTGLPAGLFFTQQMWRAKSCYWRKRKHVDFHTYLTVTARCKFY